jgi:hypothetical protein
LAVRSGVSSSAQEGAPDAETSITSKPYVS